MSAIKKKITSKDWNPKRLLGQKEEVRSLMLGRLLGVATGITRATGNDGEILEGVTGQFKYMDHLDDVSVPVLSGVLWFPSGFGLDIIHALKGEGDDKVDAVKFAFDIGVQRSENPAGYEWLFAPLIAPAPDNPLLALEAAVEKKVVAIEDKSGEGSMVDETKTLGTEKAPAKNSKHREKADA